MSSDLLFTSAIVVTGVVIIWWGMSRPSAEPGNDAWSDDAGGDSGDDS
jgi:hypothetical protein